MWGTLMEVGSAETILKWRQCLTSLSAEQPRLIRNIKCCLSLACECNEEGSVDNNCDSETGKCTCNVETIVGDKCDQTPPGYYDFPTPKG